MPYGPMDANGFSTSCGGARDKLGSLRHHRTRDRPAMLPSLFQAAFACQQFPGFLGQGISRVGSLPWLKKLGQLRLKGAPGLKTSVGTTCKQGRGSTQW